MGPRIQATAYALPPEVETAQAILERERERVEAALRPLSASPRGRALEGLGIEAVHVCGAVQPYHLALEAATAALARAGLEARDLDLVIDFTTLAGAGGEYVSFAQKLSAELGAETSLNLSFKVGGCGGLHLALKTAAALMAADGGPRTALLVAADSPPAGSRSLVPVTIQGDAGGAVVLSRDARAGPRILASEVLTLSHLHDAITIGRDGAGALVIDVASERIENEVMPIYYLNFHRLLEKALARAGIAVDQIDHFIYSNVSRRDQDGFIRALGLPEEKFYRANLARLGHTFASDLIINYTDLDRAGRIRPGQWLLFASAGIGFTWGVTVARA